MHGHDLSDSATKEACGVTYCSQGVAGSVRFIYAFIFAPSCPKAVLNTHRTGTHSNLFKGCGLLRHDLQALGTVHRNNLIVGNTPRIFDFCTGFIDLLYYATLGYY
ncbi:hypothetical protein XENOCAPTIV_022202 [Xenoophorus captivus]|uniref:Uncharacterized protein n=1 Tax=Xenoophorus captivus TaxID=1517983 RepID=A0ABV0R4E1_9TELE